MDEIADALAQETLAAIDETGDTTLEARVSETLGASSQTLQEAFQTAMRVRRAEARARALLAGVRGGARPAAPQTPRQ